MRYALIAAASIVIGVAGCSHPAADPVSSPPPSSAPQEPAPTTSDTADASETTEELPPSDPLSIQCGDISIDDSTVPTLTAAWALDGEVYECAVTISDLYQPTPAELKAIAAYAHANEQEADSDTLSEVLAVCAAKDIAAETLLQFSDRSLSSSASILCPKAPHIKLLRAVASGDVFLEGNQVVGTDIKAGKYRSETRARECYWERTSKSGKRLANDFVTFAATGVIVTIKKTDGSFTSERCGTWTRIR